MKRGLIVISLFLIFVLFSFSLVSANIFSDIWNKITGKTISGNVVADYSNINNDCQLCRRYADSNNRLNTPWSCVNFNNTALLTDFVGDVDGNDDFDLKVNCSNQEIKTGCQICRRFNDNCASGCVHNASWSCVNFDNSILLTDFTKDVNNYDYFDFKVSCSIPEMQTGCQLCRRWADNNLRATASWECKNFDDSALTTDFVNNVNSNDDFDFKVNCNIAAPTCTENWQCSDWSACSNNQQTRTCTDLNNCGTTINKPATSQSCQVTCTDTCASLGYNCGNQPVCGVSVNCGSCSSGYNCVNGRCVVSNVTNVTCVNGNQITLNINGQCPSVQEIEICDPNNPNAACPDYGIYLVYATDSSAAIIVVKGNQSETREIFEDTTKKILDLEVFLETADESTSYSEAMIKVTRITPTYTEIDRCNLINDDVKAKIRELQNYSYNTIVFKEGERVNRSQYLVIPGKIMKVTAIYNDTATFTGDEVRLTDVLSSSSLTYSAVITAEGIGTIPIGGMEYQLRYYADKTQPSDSFYIILDFPQTEESERMVFYDCEIQATCTDSDNGLDYYVKGTAKGQEWADINNTVTKTDYCIIDGEKEGRLAEYYCLDNQVASESYECPTSCQDGACIKIEDECTINLDERTCLDDGNCYWDQETSGCYKFDETKQLCSDPDDGKNYEVRAHTFGFRNYSTAEDPSRDLRIRTGGKDGCLPDNKLVEHYCSNDYYIETMHAICPVRCDLGTCTEKPCEPRYYCKVEPAICPKSGIQTKQCSDFECDTDYYTEEVQCNPGECSGCELEGKCIPYGFRKKVTIYNNQQGDYKLYCDIDGELENQKPDWQECDNSYECDSNQCSGGECIGIIQMIQNTAKFKVAAIKFVCRLFNLLSPQDYQDCLAEFMGGGTA